MLVMILLGAGGGFLVVWLGGSPEMSMLATFVGAFVPLLMHVRRRRDEAADTRR